TTWTNAPKTWIAGFQAKKCPAGSAPRRTRAFDALTDETRPHRASAVPPRDLARRLPPSLKVRRTAVALAEAGRASLRARLRFQLRRGPAGAFGVGGRYRS